MKLIKYAVFHIHTVVLYLTSSSGDVLIIWLYGITIRDDGLKWFNSLAKPLGIIQNSNS